MKKLSKTAIVGVISLVSVVATVGLAGAATYSKSGHLSKNLSILAKGGCANIGPRGFIDMTVVAKALNMELTDLTTELKSGKSISEVATAKGVDTAKLTTDLVNAASTKIDEAVQAGKLTSDQATTMKENIAQHVQNMLSHQGLGTMNKSGMGLKYGLGFGGPRGFMDMTIVAEALGMELTDLTTELKSGKSISDVATAKSVDTTTLTTTLVNAASTKIDEAVQAGKLTSDKATTIKDNLPKQIEAFLSSKGHKMINKGHKGFNCKATDNSSTQTHIQ